jgi:hypothetical protein
MDITLESGDWIERENAKWIRIHIPEYEEIWSRVVGHDGKGQPLPPNPNLAVSEFDRPAFYQAHYTVLITLLNLDALATGYDKDLPVVETPADYLHLQRDITDFMAHVGKIRDMFKIMDATMRTGPKVWKTFDDFYAQRNNVLHSAVPCIIIDSGLPQLPQPGSKEENVRDWTDSSYWDDWRNMRFKLVSEFFPQTVSELVALVRSALSKYLTFFKTSATEGLPKYQVSGPPWTTNVKGVVLRATGESGVMVPALSGLRGL